MSSKPFAKKIADHLDIELSEHEEHVFEDGEVYLKSNQNVRGCDVYVIVSLFSDEQENVNQKLFKLAFFIASLKDASADRITAVIPYMAYARQDRKDKSRSPITTKYVAMILESVGTDRVLMMDVHNAGAEQNAFRIPIDILEAKTLLVDKCVEELSFEIDDDRFALLVPDTGGRERVENFRDVLSDRLQKDIHTYQLDKRRIDRKVTASRIGGDVKGKKLLIVDDMIASGGTIKKAKDVIEDAGGLLWGIAATHGLFVGKINENLRDIPRVFVTDTIDSFRLDDSNKRNLRIVNTDKMFSKAIRRIHSGQGSISELLS